jgi:hypothetical protein
MWVIIMVIFPDSLDQVPRGVDIFTCFDNASERMLDESRVCTLCVRISIRNVPFSTSKQLKPSGLISKHKEIFLPNPHHENTTLHQIRATHFYQIEENAPFPKQTVI